MKKVLMIALVFLVAAGVAAGGYYWYAGTGPSVTYKTAKVERGDLSASISATGTLEPEEVVDVGAQVAGIIQRFGRDPQANGDNATAAATGPLAVAGIAMDPRIPYKIADWNTAVTPHTLLAEIDPQVYQSQVDQQEANVQNAQASIEVTNAKLNQSERDWNRAQQLANVKGAIADSDYDMFRATYLTNKATLAVAQAQLAQAKANLNQAKINLGYTKIYAPVTGVIVDRRVNVGQTVVASLSAPSLFLIAKDLSRMQIWASVNEADIGQIKENQKATFTVDAYPGRTFEGTVQQVRLNAQMTQQVVTYTVVVDFDNSKYKLLPYLTANLLFEVDQRHGVQLVPNSALRWQPSPAQIAPDIRKQYMHALQVKAAGGVPQATEEKDSQHRGTVWLQDGQFVRPAKVKIGLSDGSNTEIVSVIKDKEGVFGDLPDGSVVVTGTQAKTSNDDTNNPFQTKLFSGQKKQ
jgi:HlyD family secretion protein